MLNTIVTRADVSAQNYSGKTKFEFASIAFFLSSFLTDEIFDRVSVVLKLGPL